MQLRRKHEPTPPSFPQAVPEGISLQQWLSAQEAAGIVCSFCGLRVNEASHFPDPMNVGRLMCGQAIPLEVI